MLQKVCTWLLLVSIVDGYTIPGVTCTSSSYGCSLQVQMSAPLVRQVPLRVSRLDVSLTHPVILCQLEIESDVRGRCFNPQVNTQEFEEAIQDCSSPILLDVYAVWCGPCTLMAPELEKAAQALGDRCTIDTASVLYYISCHR